MATVTRYVDAPSGAGSLNGTTLENAYASIIDVINENPATASDDLIIELYGGTDVPGARLQINPTCLTLTINVREATYEVDNQTSFRAGSEFLVDTTIAGDYAFRSKATAGTSPGDGVYIDAAGVTVTFSLGLVIVGSTGTNALRIGGGTVIVNNLVIDGAALEANADGVETFFSTEAPSLTINHGTVVNCPRYGVNRAGGTVTAKNVYSGSNGTADFNGTITQTTCASSDTTADGTSYDSIAWNTTNFESVTAGDIDIGSTTATWGAPKAASGLIDQGTNLSISVDYKGASRDASPDIGAAEHLAVNYDVTGTFSNKYASTQASLSGLSWAWFDENIGALNAPTASGAVETTDDSGAFSIDVTGTALTAGQTGTLVVYDSTGGKYGAYRAIIGANGSLRLDNPGLASSYYLDSQSGVIPNIVTPPMGPWR